MTKQELIKKYKTLSDEIFIKHFKFVARAKVARAKAQIELLKKNYRRFREIGLVRLRLENAIKIIKFV